MTPTIKLVRAKIAAISLRLEIGDLTLPELAEIDDDLKTIEKTERCWTVAEKQPPEYLFMIWHINNWYIVYVDEGFVHFECDSEKLRPEHIWREMPADPVAKVGGAKLPAVAS